MCKMRAVPSNRPGIELHCVAFQKIWILLTSRKIYNSESSWLSFRITASSSSISHSMLKVPAITQSIMLTLCDHQDHHHQQDHHHHFLPSYWLCVLLTESSRETILLANRPCSLPPAEYISYIFDIHILVSWTLSWWGIFHDQQKTEKMQTMAWLLLSVCSEEKGIGHFPFLLQSMTLTISISF